VRELDPAVSPMHFFGAEVRRAREAVRDAGRPGRAGAVICLQVSRVESGLLGPTERFAVVCDEVFPQMARAEHGTVIRVKLVADSGDELFGGSFGVLLVPLRHDGAGPVQVLWVVVAVTHGRRPAARASRTRRRVCGSVTQPGPTGPGARCAPWWSRRALACAAPAVVRRGSPPAARCRPPAAFLSAALPVIEIISLWPDSPVVLFALSGVQARRGPFKCCRRFAGSCVRGSLVPGQG
jgi:hypothetical protein